MEKVIHRRYDPSTIGRKTALLQAVLSPPVCKSAHDLPSALEKWEELVRRYERRRDIKGYGDILPETIKMGLLEKIVPPEMRRHIYLNRSKISSYEHMRSEVVLYYESVLGDSNPIGGSTRHRSDPMDIGAIMARPCRKEAKESPVTYPAKPLQMMCASTVARKATGPRIVGKR